jgi:hypothetical protein
MVIHMLPSRYRLLRDLGNSRVYSLYKAWKLGRGIPVRMAPDWQRPVFRSFDNLFR